MNSRYDPSVHWTDEQLIDYLYGLGQPDAHMEACDSCRNRLTAMRARRTFLDTQATNEADWSTEALAGQRRAIYAKIESRAGWLPPAAFRRWAPAACALIMLSAGFAAWENRATPPQPSQMERVRAEVSDEQLADQVSQIADRSEPNAAAPLEALFEN